MSEAIQALDNREIATACWLTTAILLCLLKSQLRRSIAEVVRAAVAPQLLSIFAFAAVAQLLATYGLWKIGLWAPSQAKITVIWIGIGYFPFVSQALKFRDQPTTLRTQLRSVLKVTLLVEFFVNLYRLPLLLELAFVPLMVILRLFVAVSERDPNRMPANRFFLSITVAVGLIVAAYSLYEAYRAGWGQFTPNLARDFIVPIVYGLLSIPLIWLVALYSAYEEVFVRVPFVVKEPSLHAFTKFKLLTYMRFDLAALHRWCKIAWEVRPVSKADVLKSIQTAKAV